MTAPTPPATATISLRDATGQYLTTVSLPLGATIPAVIIWERRAFLKTPGGFLEVEAWVDLTGDFVGAAKADVSAALADAHRLLSTIEAIPGHVRHEVRALCQRLEQLLRRKAPTPSAPPSAPPASTPTRPPASPAPSSGPS